MMTVSKDSWAEKPKTSPNTGCEDDTALLDLTPGFVQGSIASVNLLPGHRVTGMLP